MNAILFCSEVNIAGYPEIEEPNQIARETLLTCEVYAKYRYDCGRREILKEITREHVS